MKSLSMVALVTLFILTLYSSVYCETELEITGQVRYRAELDDKYFHPNTVTYDFQLLRTRVNIDAIVKNNAHAFVQFQDSRVLGGYNLISQEQSGSLNDSKNVDLHQAYLKIDRLFWDGFGVKFGRFEFTLGNQRVFGSVGWHNIGRSWEGITGWYTNQKYKFSTFWLKKLEHNNATFNWDYDILGLSAKLTETNLEFFVVYEICRRNSYWNNNTYHLDRITTGAYFKRSFDQIDFEANVAYQFGNEVDSLDIKAYMFTGELGYSFDGERNARIALGMDITSGDDNPNDLEILTYDNLYYTGHKFRGFMDYFVPSNTSGLMDFMLRGSIVPATGWKVKGDLHYFMTTKNYIVTVPDEGTIATSDVGIEGDLTIVTTSVPGVTLTGGASAFIPEENYAGNTDMTFWSYFQVLVNF